MKPRGASHRSTVVAGVILLLAMTATSWAGNVAPDGEYGSTIDSAVSPSADSPAIFPPDPADFESAFLWEWLSLPSMTTSLRMRLTRSNAAPLPHHLALLTVQQQNATAAAMVHRDEGEASTSDLWRLGLALNRPRWTVLLGDFRVDRGLGWTVATAPSWNSSTDFSAPLRGSSSRISLNRSSEEGYGWVGVALQGVAGEDGLPSPALWAGWRGLDARDDDLGRPIPYATQGDHSLDRRSIDWWHIGAAQSLRLPDELGSLDLIATANRFPTALSPETGSARFRGIESSLLTAGLAFRGTPFRENQTWLAELTAQTPGGVGGGVSVAHDVDSRRITGAAWAAGTAFRSLHARPYTGFGSDPAGRVGTSLALEQLVGSATRAGAGVAVEGRTPPDGGSQERRMRLVTRLNHRPGDTHELDAVLRATRLSVAGDAARDDLSLRGLWRVHTDRGVQDLRAESAWDENGWAGLLGGQIRVEGRWLAVAVSLAGVVTRDQGALVSVVEPAPPGLFPVRRVGSDQLRAAGRLDALLPGNTTLWLQAGQVHALTGGSGTPSDSRVALGVEWRS